MVDKKGLAIVKGLESDELGSNTLPNGLQLQDPVFDFARYVRLNPLEAG